MGVGVVAVDPRAGVVGTARRRLPAAAADVLLVVALVVEVVVVVGHTTQPGPLTTKTIYIFSNSMMMMRPSHVTYVHTHL